MAIREINTQRNNDRITLDLQEHLLVLGRRDNGWTKELNIVAWNRGAAKFDIREWDPQHNRMSKGVTLTYEEAEKVVTAIADKLGMSFADDGAGTEDESIPFDSSGSAATASAEDSSAYAPPEAVSQTSGGMAGQGTDAAAPQSAACA